MALSIVPLDNKLRVLIVRLDGREDIRFNTRTYDRSGVEDPTRSLSPINKFFASLSSTEQDELYEIYSKISEALNHVKSRDRLTHKLKQLFVELYDTIDVDRLFHWLEYNLEINALDISEEYNPDDGPRELTYIRSEYKGLVRLGAALKPVLPILGGYIVIINKEVGTEYKEMRTMDLMDPRLIARPEWERLKVYVDINSGYAKKTTSAVYSSLSSEELPEWLMAYAIIRKLVLVDSFDDNKHIVKQIYLHLKYKMDQLDKSFGRLNDKPRPSDNPSEEDNVSLMENTTMRQELVKRIPRETSNYVTKHWKEFAKILDPDINLKFVKECIDNALKSDLLITDIQYMIAGNLIFEIDAPESVYHIEYRPMCHVLGVCQAVLFNKGFDTLAHLCTANYRLRTNDSFSFGGDGHVKSRISRVNVDALSNIYKHYRKTNAKELVAKNNVGYDWVESLTEKLNRFNIEYNPPQSMISDNAALGEPLIVPGDFKPRCSEFLFALSEMYYATLPEEAK